MHVNHLRTIIQINFIFSLTILLLVCASDHTLSVDDIPKESSGTIKCYHSKKNYLLVSTLDGKISLLNTKTGNLKWSLKVGESLLSSSIGRIEVNRNGIRTRLIPSLDGSLYQFDGKSVEPLLMNADSLLSSSFKLNDDSVIVGGKTSETYGIDILSGRLKYECSAKGCTKFGDDSVQNSEGTLVFKRSSKTVRSVEVESGMEKWNFSVGNHEVKFLSKNSQNDDFDVVSCSREEETELDKLASHKHENLNLNFVTSDGVVCAYDSEDSDCLWKQKFQSPLAQVWRINNGDITEMSLFDAKHVRSLMTKSDKPEVALNAALYIGIYNKQTYIKPSMEMQNYLESRQSISTRIPKLKWVPYMAKAPSKTQALTGPLNLLKIGWSATKSTGISVWQKDESLIKDGIYLFPDKSFRVSKTTTYKRTQIFSNQSVINEYAVFTFHYVDWRSLLAAVIVCVVLIRVLYTKYKSRKRTISETTTGSASSKSDTDTIIDIDKNSEYSRGEFESRYQNDFEQLAVLGKGGFGVVFEARNHIDKVKYAVKRICTSSDEKAERKVLREAQALAKLDHPGIVRYYQSWVERPPLGWQETRDFQNDHLKDYMSGSEYSQNPTTETARTVNFSSKLTTSYSFTRDDDCNESDFEVEFSHKLPNNISYSRKGSNNNLSDSFSIVFEESCNSKDDGLLNVRNRKNADDTTEVESKASFKHSVSKSASPKNYIYIQMQLCVKKNLADWLFSRDVIDKEESFGIFHQIVSAVEYIHSNGFIHRDLKPSNIFFSLDDQIKVGDFGLAIKDEGLQEFSDTNSSRSYKHTRDVGTKLYMSPEQINGLHYNSKIDIFSLGLLFVELLHLFNTEMERRMTLEKVKSLNFPPDFSKKNKVEQELISKMLNTNPDSRPKASEIIDLELFSQFTPSNRGKQRTRSTSSTSSL